jgi:dihydropyrimidinase
VGRRDLAEALARDRAAAARDASVDYVLHPVLTDPAPQHLAEIPALAAKGYGSLKVFMVSPQFDASADAYIEAIASAGANGLTTMIHCEDGPIIRCTCRRLLALGRGDVAHWPESRPDYAEAAAVERAIAICRATEEPLYLVHISSQAALEACRRARADGVPVSVETRPLYLHLTSERLREPDGAKYVGAPPLRETADVRAVWNALYDGTVQTVCTDHAPWTLEQKLDPSLDVSNARQGVADRDTALPMLFSTGVGSGRITIERFVELVATNPARLFGLYPRKGTIAVGADADLVVWDPELGASEAAKLQSRASCSVLSVPRWPRDDRPRRCAARGRRGRRRPDAAAGWRARPRLKLGGEQRDQVVRPAQNGDDDVHRARAPPPWADRPVAIPLRRRLAPLPPLTALFLNVIQSRWPAPATQTVARFG